MMNIVETFVIDWTSTNILSPSDKTHKFCTWSTKNLIFTSSWSKITTKNAIMNKMINTVHDFLDLS